MDTIMMKPVQGIPTWNINDMQWSHLEIISGNPPGSYIREPVRVYREFSLKAGVCYIDQWIPENPLKMAEKGFDENVVKTATTGADEIICDGMLIDSPEAVVGHMEQKLFMKWKQMKKDLEENEEQLVKEKIEAEAAVQKLFGDNILKGPYSRFFMFPEFLYRSYGYSNYFMAYALYPEVIEKGFDIYADTASVSNRISARAIKEGGLPAMIRLDHDMADSRGTLVDVKTLDKMWFPHFQRAIQPLIDAGILLIWHCDGNLSEMVPRLIDSGIGGFQGFQYEDGMDYEKICSMKAKNGNSLFIVAGISVTTTLPFGRPADVKEQMRWLVEKGPRTGLMLGCSSSVAPGVPLENIRTMIEGFEYYRKYGRESK